MQQITRQETKLFVKGVCKQNQSFANDNNIVAIIPYYPPTQQIPDIESDIICDFLTKEFNKNLNSDEEITIYEKKRIASQLMEKFKEIEESFLFREDETDGIFAYIARVPITKEVI